MEKEKEGRKKGRKEGRNEGRMNRWEERRQKERKGIKKKTIKEIRKIDNSNRHTGDPNLDVIRHDFKIVTFMCSGK